MSDSTKLSAAKVAIIYFLAASVWILLWDLVLAVPLRIANPSGRTISWPAWGWTVFSTLALLLVWHRQRQTEQQRESSRQNQIEQLQARAHQAQTILQNAADGVIAADAAGTIDQFNPAAARMFGYSPSEIIGQNIRKLIPRPYLPAHPNYQISPPPPSDTSFLNWGREVFGCRKDGRQFPLELAVSEVGHGPRRLFIAIVRDISDRKQTEHQLTQSREQLRSLAAHLQSIREEERTRIAREIHDELGQALTGVKMDLAWLLARLRPDQTSLTQRVRSTSSLIDNTIQTVRKIATELRPGVLDNLGLPAALEWQTAEFEKHTGITCSCASHLEQADLDPTRKTVLFRIFQETLTNVARHAGASRVEITLSEENNLLRLQIQDNGRGITPEEVAGTQSLGLLGIRERAAMVGGHVHIQGRTNAGTTVTVTIPRAASPATQPTS